MSYLGITDVHWLFANSIGQVYGVHVSSAKSFGEAYEKAFSHFFG